MINKIKELIRIYWPALLIFLLMALVFGYCWHLSGQKEKPVLMTEEQARDERAVEDKANVTQPEAREIIREIDRSDQPAAVYYVTAPTLESGAEKVQKQIASNDESAPAVATKKSDRTIVTTNKEKQNVEVYKITLRKAHKVKAGMTYVDNKAYANVGYQAGRWEGIAHFNREGIKGGTVMYTVKEW